MAYVVLLAIFIAYPFAPACGAEPVAPAPTVPFPSGPDGRQPPPRWPTPRRHLPAPMIWHPTPTPGLPPASVATASGHQPRRQRRSRLPCQLRPPGSPPSRCRSFRRSPRRGQSRRQRHRHRPASPNLAAHRDTDSDRDTGAGSGFGRTASGRAGNAQCTAGKRRCSAPDLAATERPRSMPRRLGTAVSSATGARMAPLPA